MSFLLQQATAACTDDDAAVAAAGVVRIFNYIADMRANVDTVLRHPIDYVPRHGLHRGTIDRSNLPLTICIFP
eukprot:scaffold18198_cov43-Prasinocladus_malaysianus.AAC.2